MIKEKLLIMEYDLIKNISANSNKLKALKVLKLALLHVDFNVERIPNDDLKRLNALFESLLDRKLNTEELCIIENLTLK